MKYGDLNLGQVEAIVNRLGGMEGVKRFLAGEFEVKEVECKFWRAIKREPALNSPKAFLSALAEKNRNTSGCAEDIIGKPAFVESLNKPEQEYDLFVITTAQLTGKKDASSTIDEVFNGIKRLKFCKCPAWLGPQLRLDYEDQPNGECLYTAMEPIRASGGLLFVFGVKCHDSDLWLDYYFACPGYTWYPGDRWVVCRSRKVS